MQNQGRLAVSRHWSERGQTLSLLLPPSFAHTDGRKLPCLADRVSWIGTPSSSSISPRWSALWTAQRASEKVAMMSRPCLLVTRLSQILDCSGPRSCGDVSAEVSLMLMASPAPRLSCRDSLRLGGAALQMHFTLFFSSDSQAQHRHIIKSFSMSLLSGCNRSPRRKTIAAEVDAECSNSS